LSNESNEVTKNNIQFVDIGVYIFGENPEVLNPATMQLNNPEAVRQSEKTVV